LSLGLNLLRWLDLWLWLWFLWLLLFLRDFLLLLRCLLVGGDQPSNQLPL
jgi:hypothetical protein